MRDRWVMLIEVRDRKTCLDRLRVYTIGCESKQFCGRVGHDVARSLSMPCLSFDGTRKEKIKNSSDRERLWLDQLF